MNKQKQTIILNSNNDSASTLETLNDLITALSEGERTTYNHIIRSTKFQANAFENYSSWSDDCYTRNCIVDNEKFELILICWCKGHQTPIHDHGGETIYKQNETGNLNIVKTSISKSDEVTYMKDFMGFHRLQNLSNKRSMSLHLYAKPIRKCRVFDEDSKTFSDKNMDYDTIA